MIKYWYDYRKGSHVEGVLHFCEYFLKDYVIINEDLLEEVLQDLSEEVLSMSEDCFKRGRNLSKNFYTRSIEDDSKFFYNISVEKLLDNIVRITLSELNEDEIKK